MTVKLIQGDITEQKVDAIVNAANSSLMGGGGVDGAIHSKGGPEILQACLQIVDQKGPCPAGSAVITSAGNLPARFVIHTVGPVWQGGDQGEEELLASCYKTSLDLAIQHQVKSLAFPNISTGVYRFPKWRAASIVKQTLDNLSEEHGAVIDEVRLVCFDEENYSIYKQVFSA